MAPLQCYAKKEKYIFLTRRYFFSYKLCYLRKTLAEMEYGFILGYLFDFPVST